MKTKILSSSLIISLIFAGCCRENKYDKSLESSIVEGPVILERVSYTCDLEVRYKENPTIHKWEITSREFYYKYGGADMRDGRDEDISVSDDCITVRYFPRLKKFKRVPCCKAVYYINGVKTDIRNQEDLENYCLSDLTPNKDLFELEYSSLYYKGKVLDKIWYVILDNTSAMECK